jgi:ABC-type tungstate transport system substrate-binding protein/ABC-type sulfate/molybdate transport systems ATPase subunit
MDVLWEGLREAWRLLTSGDPETFEIIGRSLTVSLSATAIAFALGLPLGMLLAFGRFPGRRLALAAVNTGMGLPPVVVGLFITVLLWRSGPFGSLDLLYTPAAMVVAQAVIAFPLVAGISAAALQQIDPDFRVQMAALGASRPRGLWTVAVEARLPLLAAVMAGFGAVVSEVGAATMVGGNIAGETRVLTTAAVLEASRGEFGAAMAFGIVLLVIAFAVNLVLTAAQHPGRHATRCGDLYPHTGYRSPHPATVEPISLELRDVQVRAGGRTILSVPRLALGPGVTAVLGANGAGKSTLLRVAGALRRPDAGAVLIAGAPAEPRDLRRVTAAVLQRPLLRRGSTRANVETGLRFRHVNRREAHGRAHAWMDQLAIPHLADRQTQTLSGGEAQRVSLARALAIEPAVLLLDEPFAGLDAPTRGELIVDLREALTTTGTAALLVTHDRHEAAALADHIAILHAGELRQHGETVHVLANPADRDCARILGYENLLSAETAERLLGEGSGPRALRAADCAAEPAGREPEAATISVSDARDAATLAARQPTTIVQPTTVLLTATLTRVVPLGPTSRVIAHTNGETLLATAPAPPPQWLASARPGEPIRIRFPKEAARPIGEL